jgi:hypothetical protein
VAVRWDGRYDELDLGSRFELLSPPFAQEG